MRGQLTLLLLLVACESRGTAELYRDALHARTWEEGRALCERLPAAEAPDCVVAVAEALGRLDPTDCDAVPEGVWRDECVFTYAERLARAGDAAGGFAACERTRFGRHCTYHLVREDARAALDRPLPEAAVATRAYTGLRLAPDAPRMFWQTWFRERMHEVPVDPTGCAALGEGAEACRLGARDTIERALDGLHRAAGPSFCERPPDGAVGARAVWARTAETDAWVTAFRARACGERNRPAEDGAAPNGHGGRAAPAGEVSPG